MTTIIGALMSEDFMALIPLFVFGEEDMRGEKFIEKEKLALMNF